ncbi:LicD family protein [Lactiplantibacillus herbarum]|uniref:LicD family protein n=1 Tax=Lactiplantibacillus herbarum TaxID=1670446 RepID=UPI00064F4865|nr:LicD family protein [Lactiplantibacillus herbarum]
MNSKIVEISGNELKKYQHEVLKIAKDVARFCEKNDIVYTLSGGSVLGAVRHNGFIPWDDDIDINMPRKDYDKFVSMFIKEYSSEYYVQTPQRDPKLGLLITQIRKKGTIARRRYDMENENCGISIDIYIMENVYDGNFLFNIQKFGAIFFLMMVSGNRAFHNRNVPAELERLEHRQVNHKFLKKTFGSIVGIFPTRLLINCAYFFFKMCRNSESSRISLPTGRRHFDGELFRRQDMCVSIDHKFEDTHFKIPANYTVYLTRLYGDYMVIPPRSEEEHHLFLELKY